MKKILTISILLSLLASCASQSFIADKRHYKVTYPSYSKTNHFLFWGIGQTKVMEDPSQYCKKGKVAKVVFKETPVNVILMAITFGIYFPRTTEVYCIQ